MALSSTSILLPSRYDCGMQDVNIGTNPVKQVPAAAIAVAKVLMVLFLLPFMGVGAFVAYSGLQQLRGGQPLGSALPLIAFGLVFMAIPAAIVVGMLRAMKSLSADAKFRSANASTPWLWRKEWADGTPIDRTVGGTGVSMTVAIIFIAVSSPILFILRREVERGNYVALIGLVFPVVGAILLTAGLYRLLRAHKYGASILRLDRIPIEPGRPARFDVQTHVTELPEAGFQVKLTCVRRRVTGGGRNRSTSESILWRDEQTIRSGAPSPDGVRLPITFSIPADAQPSDERNPSDRVIWRLDVSAEVPGIDYAAQFELPVFNAGETPEEPKAAAHAPVDLSSWRPDPESLITLSPTVDGEEIHVRSHARLTETLSLGIFNLLWFGFIALMFVLHAPFIFPFLFGIFGVIILVLLFDFAFGRTTIRASRRALQIRRSWFGIGSTRSVDPAQIDSVTTVVGMTSGGGNGTPYYNVRLRIKDGKESFAAKYIRSRRDAEALAEKIEKECGLAAPAS